MTPSDPGFRFCEQHSLSEISISQERARSQSTTPHAKFRRPAACQPVYWHDHLASPRYLKRAKIHLKIIVVSTRDAPREASLYVVGLVNQRATLLARLLPPSSRLPSWQLLKLILTNNCRNRARNAYCGGGTASSPSAAATRALALLSFPQ